MYLAKFGDIQNMKVKKNLKHPFILHTIVTMFSRFFLLKISIFLGKFLFKKGNLCENIPLPRNTLPILGKGQKIHYETKITKPIWQLID